MVILFEGTFKEAMELLSGVFLSKGDQEARQKRHRDNPELAAKSTGLGWVELAPGIEGDYKIIRRTTCDSTLYFAYQLLARALEPIILRQSHHTEHGWHPEIRYRIGTITLTHQTVGSPDPKRPWLTDEFTATVPVETILPEGVLNETS